MERQIVGKKEKGDRRSGIMIHTHIQSESMRVTKHGTSTMYTLLYIANHGSFTPRRPWKNKAERHTDTPQAHIHSIHTTHTYR